MVDGSIPLLFEKLYNGGMYTGIFLAVIAVLIFVHELGHFLAAKLCGVGVLEFALGFGPTLFRYQRRETTYAVRAIPLGGFVRMAGDDPEFIAAVQAGASADELLQGDEIGGASAIEGTQVKLSPDQLSVMRDQRRWFLTKGYLPRCVIVIAGPLFNILFAWLLATAMLVQMGMPKVLEAPVIAGIVDKEVPAAKAGIRSGDKITKVNGKEVATFNELVDIVRGSEGKALQITLERKGERGKAEEKSEAETISVEVTPQPQTVESKLEDGSTRTETVYRIGMFNGAITYEPVSFLAAIRLGGKQVSGLAKDILASLGRLLTFKESPTKSMGGPLEMAKQTAKSADAGLPATIAWMIFLNVSLALMNLFPIPVLDGGHLVLFTVDAVSKGILGRPLGQRAQQVAASIGLTLILSLMIFVVWNDIMRLFGS